MLKTKRFLKWVLITWVFVGFSFASVVYAQIRAVKNIGFTISDMEDHVVKHLASAVRQACLIATNGEVL